MAFVLFLIYLSLTYVRPYELFPSLAPLRLMLVVGSIGVVAAMGSIPFSGLSLRAKQLPVLVAFVLWTAFSLILALHWLGGGLQALSTFSITLIVFFLAVVSVNTEQRLRIAFKVMIALCLLLVFLDFLAVHFGVFHSILVIDELQASGISLSRVRGTGFMKDPNDLAQTLVTVIPFVAMGWNRKAGVQNILFVALPTIILLYGIYLTHSRGAIVSLMVMLFVATRSKLGTLGSTITLGFGGLALAVMMIGGRGFGMDRSASNRLEAWSEGLQLLKQHPFSGVGFGMFTDFHEITAHNSFVLCFSELGFPGYFLWLTLLVITAMEFSAIRQFPVKTEADKRLRQLARTLQISFYGFLVSAWFLSRTYNVVLYLLIALAIAVAEIARRSGKSLDRLTFPVIMTRTAMVMVGSIVLVYLQIKFQVR